MATSPSLLRLLPLSAASLLVLFPSRAPAEPSPSDLPAFRAAMLAEINRFRSDHDLPPLKADPRLETASQEWAERIAADRRLQHRSDASLSSLLDTGGWETINENLYYASRSPDPAKVLADWKRSPFHRKNLLNPAIRFAGIGRALTSDGAAYVVFNGAGGKRSKNWKELWESLPFGHRSP